VATPTLVKYSPLPLRRFIGSMSGAAGPFFTLDPIAKGKMVV
jgi:hypothetical protein